jgi:PAS domain S-box-containing protein
MSYHKLLQKQINKYLTPECTENPLFKDFIQAVNHSYQSYERDNELMNHAFKESEKEYNQINDSLKKEFDLKKQSISNLYDSLEVFEDGFDEIKNEDDVDDLLFISKYLSKHIEKRKEIENNLSTTIELLKTLLANFQSGILVEDENRKILFTNQQFCDMFAIPVLPEMMIGADCAKSAEQSKHLFKNADHFQYRIENIIKQKKVCTNELLETIDNRFFERDYIPIYIDNKYKGHLWKYTDVTQRIQSKTLLMQSEERNRLIMNSALNAIINIDTEGKIIFWNKKAENIFGWNSKEVLGKPLTDTIIPERYKSMHSQGLKNFVETGVRVMSSEYVELPAVNKEGIEFPVEISVIPIRQNNELFLCSFIQDISKRKIAENNLKFQEEKYRNMIANMNLGLIEVDNDEIIKYANQSFLEISGYEMDDLIGKSPSELFVFGENVKLIKTKKNLREEGISDIYQIQIKNKRGEMRWWAISGAPNFDDKGNLVGSIGIHLDITEQKQLEIDLENEKLKAEEASRAKESFLANMSHEIRTPLNAIIGFLRELNKQDLSDLQKKYIENSTIASKHLLAIINNILDISKIEAGEMSIENEDFALENTINKIIKVLHPKATQKGITLCSNINPLITDVLKGDSLRIEQILFNLMGNSLKFTQKGKICINCNLIKDYPNSQDISISVADTGIGMEKEYLNSIFNKFSQEDIQVTRKFGGTGLGMAITKELVQLMKGRIEIESEKNKGTTIHVFLNLKKGDRSNLKSAHLETASTSLKNISILLVEDSDMNRMVAQNSLQHYSCKVTEAENGVEALKILKKENFDIILMDIQMPEIDGIETTKIIRNKLKLNIPIVALTANAFKSEIEKCKKAGMNDYITKPFNETNLIETIAKHTIKKGNKILKTAEITDNQKLYDLSSLNNLSRGNKKFVEKMIIIFIEQTSSTIEKVEKAIENKNYKEITQLIHKIKPSIEAVGVISILDDIKKLEKLAIESGDIAKINTIFLKIKKVLKEVISQFNKSEIE